MKKRILSLLLMYAIAFTAMAEGKVKYVFYFIGDGMGVNQINVTETYLAALKGKIGFEPILMSSFPVVGLVNTYSATNGVTDSAAGGTALACGKKTKNGTIGTEGRRCSRRGYERGHYSRHTGIVLRAST